MKCFYNCLITKILFFILKVFLKFLNRKRGVKSIYFTKKDDLPMFLCFRSADLPECSGCKPCHFFKEL